MGDGVWWGRYVGSPGPMAYSLEPALSQLSLRSRLG